MWEDYLISWKKKLNDRYDEEMEFNNIQLSQKVLLEQKKNNAWLLYGARVRYVRIIIFAWSGASKIVFYRKTTFC